MKYIVLNKPSVYLQNSVPSSWKNDWKLIDPKDFPALEIDENNDEFFACNDLGYDTAAHSDKIKENRGFSELLSDIANHKYKSRNIMKTMQTIQYVLCENNIVDWPYDRADRLVAKPVHGSRAEGVIIDVRHGDVLPDIEEPYLVEKFIDEKYQRVTVDGYVCGDKIGILSTSDTMYVPREKDVQYYYVGFPSKFWNKPLLLQRYTEIVQELKKITGCDNQIIDIEFFAMENDFIPMEINPRIFSAIPVYEATCGVNPWEFMSNLINGRVMELPKCPPKAGLIRYNQLTSNIEKPELVKHDEDTFSIQYDDFSQTYSVCDVSKPYWELIKEIDGKYPIGIQHI